MNSPYFMPVSIVIGIIGFGLGIFVFLKPELTIEIQRRFYEKINWRIEPISMSKEIRNTRIMGAFLVLVCLFIGACLVLRRWF